MHLAGGTETDLHGRRTMNDTTFHLASLNLYCTSALHTARLLGQMARRAVDPRLRLELARRAADAHRHAQLWAETIRAIGARPQTSAPALQRLFEERVGRADTVLHVLALTHTCERRLARQWIRHFHRPDTDPTVRATLRRMLEEELRPGWVLPWLEQLGEADRARCEEVRRRYAEADAEIADPLDEPERFLIAA
jgi:hypothetical protein